MEIVPKDTDVLVFDSGPFVRVVRRSEVFTEVERPLRVERSLLDISRLSTVICAGVSSGLFLVVHDGALRQLAGELVKGSLSSFDVHATRGGQARRGVVGTLHTGKEYKGRQASKT